MRYTVELEGSDEMKRGIRIALILICTAVFAAAAWQIGSTLYGYRQGRETYETFAADFAVSAKPEEEPEPVTSEATPLEPAAVREADTAVIPPVSVDFDALLAENPDVVGWIYGEDTVINYPVVQGSDNSYYLKHLIDGTYNKDGSIFVDANNRRAFSDGNTIIYGHNMKDGMMFADLLNYADQSYYESHPVLWLLTPEENYQILLFAGYTTDGSSDTYTIFSAPGQETQAYADQMIARSDFKSDVAPGPEDKLVVLSTCAYSQNNARYAVHGVLRPCG